MKISVIIPIYNVAPYLKQCIKSVLSQTHTDFECILVDDGSSDGSSEICDSFKETDSRIRVLHQCNKGVSAARNAGIDISTGDFITFIDSDDWVENDHLELLFKSQQENNSELSLLGFELNTKSGTTYYTPAQSTVFGLNIHNTPQFIDLCNKHLLFSPCFKLYLSSVIKKHHISFNPDLDYGEDLIFNISYLNYIRKISCIDKAKYHYRIVDGNISLSTKPRDKQFDTNYKQWLELKKFFADKGLWCQITQEFLYKRLWGIIIDSIFDLNNLNFKYYKHILSIPEITKLKEWQHVYNCANWIKWCILRRKYTLLHLVLLQQKARRSFSYHFRSFKTAHFNYFPEGIALKRLKNRHKGQRCFIIGNGPSLSATDLDTINRNNEISFAFNRIYHIFDDTDWRPTYYASQDEKILHQSVDSVNGFPAKIKFIPIERKWHDNIKPLNVQYFHLKHRLTDNKPHFSSDISRFIINSNTVVYTAMQIAVYMGIREIYLIGIDHHFHTSTNNSGDIIIDDNAKDYFSDKYNTDKKDLYIPNMEASTLTYIAAKEFADANNIKIYNATRGGHLEVFPRVDFDTLF